MTERTTSEPGELQPHTAAPKQFCRPRKALHTTSKHMPACPHTCVRGPRAHLLGRSVADVTKKPRREPGEHERGEIRAGTGSVARCRRLRQKLDGHTTRRRCAVPTVVVQNSCCNGPQLASSLGRARGSNKFSSVQFSSLGSAVGARRARGSNKFSSVPVSVYLSTKRPPG